MSTIYNEFMPVERCHLRALTLSGAHEERARAYLSSRRGDLRLWKVRRIRAGDAYHRPRTRQARYRRRRAMYERVLESNVEDTGCCIARCAAPTQRHTGQLNYVKSCCARSTVRET